MEQQRFIKRGRDVFTASDRGDEIEKIPTGVYTVKFNPMIGFYLGQQEDITLPTKLYGAVEGRARKALSTFKSREGVNTGVILSGNKGSGKTLLSRVISALALKDEMPVILVEEPYSGQAFNEFMNSITQRVVVFIDEFEKKYREHEKQNELLSLMDGTGVNNKMFILTMNDGNVSEFLLSRPNRMFYHWRYAKLEEEVMLGYCNDNLDNKEHLDRIRVFWGISTDISFDVLQSIVEELNRYPDRPFVELILDMNVALGNATKMPVATTSVIWGDKKLHANSHTMGIDLIAIHEGDYTFNVSYELESWEDFLAHIKFFGEGNCYHRNYFLMSKHKEGAEITQEMMDDFDGDFRAYIKLDASTDSFSTIKGARFDRLIGGRPFSALVTPVKGKTEKDILEGLFS